MKRSIIGGLVLSLALLLVSFPVLSFTQNPSPSRQNPEPETEARINSLTNLIEFPSSRTGVRIDVQNLPLEDVLQEISQKTGIRFKVAPSLANQALTASFQAPDWKTGIETLLKEISTVTLWRKNSRMSEVILLRNRDGSEVFSSQPDDSKEPSINSENMPLTLEQLKIIAKGPFQSPLPAELLGNPQFSVFLRKHGIETPEDLQKTRKAMKVRKVARLQLRKLKEKGAN